jgi:hypothetical protein
MNNALFRSLAIWLFALGVAAAAAPDVRFSHTLGADERAASGLSKLSSDEVAVIDALVRRDAVSRVSSAGAETEAATFSQRLTADEQRTAGLSKLSQEELPKLNGFVTRYQSAKLARTLLAPPTYLARSSRVSPTEAKKEREIHGSFSLSYGMGSGGYSEKTGSMILTMDDPARRYSISIGYSESHIKGGYGYPGLYYDRDPFYDRDRLDGRDPFFRDSLNRSRDVYYGTRDPFYVPARHVPEGPLDRP